MNVQISGIRYQEGSLKGLTQVFVKTDADVVTPLPLPEINPRSEFRHSPGGFEWGYRGSGPAEFARAILLAFCDTEDARYVRHPACYRRFRDAFLAGVRADTFGIDRDTTLGWLSIWKAENQDLVEHINEDRRLEEEIARLDELEAHGG